LYIFRVGKFSIEFEENTKKAIMKGFSHTGVREFSVLKKQKQRSYSFDFFSERPLSCVERDKFGLRQLIMLLRLN